MVSNPAPRDLSNTPSFALFFYGTLIHPAVLARVTGSDGAHLTTRAAVLHQHTRHHVKGEDYPAVVPASAGRAILLGRVLSQDEASVRGSLVTGLTAAEVAFLDEFEGDEYTRTKVSVCPLSDGEEPVSAEVYLWTAPLSRLEPALWTYEAFLRDKAHRWVGTGAGKEYEEVERRRAMAGSITPGNQEEMQMVEPLPEFGKSFREKYWSFEEGWLNVNHGSYGAAPNPVIEEFRALQDASAAAPDRFMRLEYVPKLIALRSRLAELVGCDTDDLVMVDNATLGINVVLRSLTTVWEKNDKILYFSTTIYDACSSTLQYIVDTHPHLSLSLVPVQLAYPISHADVIAVTKKVIEEQEAQGGKIRLALIDAISSNPGVVVPWEDLTKLFKEKGIISLIDAAHQIGQLPVKLSESQPDYWVSNCHKWLMGHRGCAVLYVAKHNQHLIHSLPIGHSYASRSPSPNGVPDWVLEFEWNGTRDWSPLLSVAAALDFRQQVCGGEKRITTYCHALAIEGGELVAGILGTETMRNKEGDGELVANMINIRLPIEFPSSTLPEDERNALLRKQRSFLYTSQINDYKTIAPGFTHAGAWWVRLSAQVYNDLEDFAKVGQVLKEVCDKIRRGEMMEMVWRE